MSEQGQSCEIVSAWLAENDTNCPRCGYSLRGLRPSSQGDSVCPECELLIELQVVGSLATPAPWLVAFAACAMGLGFDSVVVSIISIIAIFAGGGGEASVIVMILMLSGLGIGCLLAMLRLRDQRTDWIRLPVDTQKSRATRYFAAVFLVHVLAAGLFLLWVMNR